MHLLDEDPDDLDGVRADSLGIEAVDPFSLRVGDQVDVFDRRVPTGHYTARVSQLPEERGDDLYLELYQKDPITLSGREIEEDEVFEYEPDHMVLSFSGRLGDEADSVGDEWDE